METKFGNINPDNFLPFALTAKCDVAPEKLYTKLLVANRYMAGEPMKAKYVNAMWDTGAPTSFMTPELAKDLGIKYEGPIYASGIGGKQRGWLGIARIALVSNGGMLETVVAIVPSNKKKKYSFVIGMDIINKGAFAVSSTSEGMTLSFTMPCYCPIDFTEFYKDHPIKKEVVQLSSGEEWQYDQIYEGSDATRLIKPKRD